jgi:Ca2+-binding RTX toxin-like protein
MTGGAGLDQFVFFKPTEGVDHITDFKTGELIVIEGSAFGLGEFKGYLPVSRQSFSSGAKDHDDRIVFNGASHTLYFDADGSGAGHAIKFAVLDNFTPTTPDFIYVI